MAAAATDKFLYTGNPGTATTLSAPGYTIGASSITVGSTTDFPTATGVVFGVDTASIVNGVQVRNANSYCVFSGVVTGGNTISSLTLEFGTPQNYAAGALTRVYITVSTIHNKRLIDGLLVGHAQDGSHVASLPLTTPKITTGLSDANGNTEIAFTATSSAVNNLQAVNAASGADPSLRASGSGTNLNVNVRGKGTGKLTIGAGALAPFVFDYIASGCIWTADAAGSTRLASMTSGVVVINGNPLTVAAVTSRTFTASKDVYVDFTDNGDGTALLTYTDNTTNAASPALTGLRNAIVVVGASNIATAASINQGQEDRVVPIASSIPYCFTDSLGNIICPRDPFRRIIGYRQMVANAQTTGTSDMAALNLTCIIPTGRKVRVSGFIGLGSSSVASNAVGMILVDVTASANLASSANSTSASGDNASPAPMAISSAGGTRNYKAQITRGSNAATASSGGSSTNPNYLMVELV